MRYGSTARTRASTKGVGATMIGGGGGGRLLIASAVLWGAASSFSASSPLRPATSFGVVRRVGGPLRSAVAVDDDASTTTPLSLFNSLSRTKEPFAPLAPPYVSMYTCGPTVYDHAHVGNFRAFLTYDVLKRALRYFGYDVDHVCNLTDVDDKIIARCDREGVSLIELTERFTDLFMEDLSLLNIVPARLYPKATEHVEEMVDMVLDLQRNGLAYESATDKGSWYFEVSKKDGYGQQLVDLDVANMRTSVLNDDADEYDADKEGARDFALWKAYKPGVDRDDSVWNTRLGRGRPGWHLECSAMAKKYLGNNIDLHAGGVDLKFPHHENEIAQSEGSFGDGSQFCKCWVHNGFVNIGDEKMSKSKGNFLTLRNACPTPVDIRAYRYLVVSSQYRSPLSFTDRAMDASKKALKRMDRARGEMAKALAAAEASDVSENDSEMTKRVAAELANFRAALADDLSMPRAAAALFGVVKLAETEFKRVKKLESDDDDDGPPLDVVGVRAAADAVDEMDRVFGIFYEVPTAEGANDDESGDSGANVPAEVMELVEQRAVAKSDKDWELADSLRNRISELGFVVKDVKGGAPEVTRI